MSTLLTTLFLAAVPDPDHTGSEGETSSSPIVQWVLDSYAESPVVTVVVGLVALAILLYLLKSAIKLFIGIVLLAALALVGSYFIQGEDETNKLIQDGVDKAGEKVDEMRDKGLINFSQDPNAADNGESTESDEGSGD